MPRPGDGRERGQFRKPINIPQAGSERRGERVAGETGQMSSSQVPRGPGSWLQSLEFFSRAKKKTQMRGERTLFRKISHRVSVLPRGLLGAK